MAETQLKVIVLGEANVGKTSLLSTMCRSLTDTSMDHNIEVFDRRVPSDQLIISFYCISHLNGANRKTSDVSVITLPDEDYVPKSFYQNAHGAIIIFSTDDQKSVDSVDKWVKWLKQYCGEIPLVLVQSKVDLIEASKLDLTAVELKAKQLKVRLYRVSTVEKLNVDELFEYILEKCRKALSNYNASSHSIAVGTGPIRVKSADWSTTSDSSSQEIPSKRRTGGLKPVFNRHKVEEKCKLM